MLNRFIPVIVVFCLSLPSARAQEASAALRARLEQALSRQVNTLRQISRATTEGERAALGAALDGESGAWPASLQARIDAGQRRFEAVRCAAGSSLRRGEDGVPYCLYADGSEEGPLLSRWLWQEEELLYACTLMRNAEAETQMCSRLNLLTDELIGRNLQDAFDSSYLQADTYVTVF